MISQFARSDFEIHFTRKRLHLEYDEKSKSLLSFFEFLFISKVRSIQEIEHFGVENPSVVYSLVVDKIKSVILHSKTKPGPSPALWLDTTLYQAATMGSHL